MYDHCVRLDVGIQDAYKETNPLIKQKLFIFLLNVRPSAKHICTATIILERLGIQTSSSFVKIS